MIFGVSSYPGFCSSTQQRVKIVEVLGKNHLGACHLSPCRNVKMGKNVFRVEIHCSPFESCGADMGEVMVIYILDT